MSMATTRLAHELKVLKQSGKTEEKLDGSFDESNIVLHPRNESNLFEWTALIRGPPETPFENGQFRLKIQVPAAYPHSPPVIHFVTQICHPNIHFKTGEICLDTLKDNWTPVWTLESTCRAIVSLLATPQPASPLNCDAGNLLRCGDYRGYWSLARMYTLEFARMLPPLKVASPAAPASESAGAGAGASAGADVGKGTV